VWCTQFAKHHYATYPPSITKGVNPFDLVHFDVGCWHQIIEYLVLNNLSLLLMKFFIME